MSINNSIPVLIDFDGVIRIGNYISRDTDMFFRFLFNNNIPFFIISNSTQLTGNDIKEILRNSGITIEIQAMSTVDATIDYLSESKKKANIYCKDEIKKYFTPYETKEIPDAVVIGDLEEKWSYALLNEIFRKVNAGAEMIAMQKNKYWKPTGKELSLDAGSFIAAIEYASSKKSLLIGKPSPYYFRSAIKRIKFPTDSRFIMIGDDLETDIAGSQSIGGIGILLYTGKTQKSDRNNFSIIPDYEANNLQEAMGIITQILFL